jgi:hypothetical protein
LQKQIDFSLTVTGRWYTNRYSRKKSQWMAAKKTAERAGSVKSSMKTGGDRGGWKTGRIGFIAFMMEQGGGREAMFLPAATELLIHQRLTSEGAPRTA